MSVSLGVIQNNYMQSFPTEVPTKTAQGFIITATINLLNGYNCSVALVGGAIAAIATIIEAVTRPIIRAIFSENPNIAKFIQIVIPKMMALGLAALVAPWIGVSYKMTSVLLPIIAWITLNEGFYERNVGMVEVL